jgi:hypothetical protein
MAKAHIAFDKMSLKYVKRKSKEQSRIYNPETMATLDIKDTGRRQTKQKTQHRKLKISATRTPPKTGLNPEG